MKTDVLIIGAGLAGLSCANTLTHAGISNLIVEADDGVGGRARTDRVNGFLLDRGFQVFLTAYPEAKQALNFDALNLQSFYPGAMVRFNGHFHHMSDPFRHPFQAIRSLTSPIGTLADKVRMAAWRQHVSTSSIEEIFQKPDSSTMQYLLSMRFSQTMIDRFLRPFLGGVFMDQTLNTSSRATDFLFKMFASGDTTLPEQGIGALAQQLAHKLQPDQIRTSEKAIKIQGTTVTLESGELLTARHVVVATEETGVKHLVPDFVARPTLQTNCLYFCMSELPLAGPYLILNGGQDGIINSMCFLTEVAHTYAPSGKHLLSVTTRENANHANTSMEETVRSQLVNWFGSQVKNWQHLRTYRLLNAQPALSPPFVLNNLSPSKIRAGLYMCGDHRSTATFNGAIGSGRETAQEIINELTT